MCESFVMTYPDELFNLLMDRLVEFDRFVDSKVDKHVARFDCKSASKLRRDGTPVHPPMNVPTIRRHMFNSYTTEYHPHRVHYHRLMELHSLFTFAIQQNILVQVSASDYHLLQTNVSDWK